MSFSGFSLVEKTLEIECTKSVDNIGTLAIEHAIFHTKLTNESCFNYRIIFNPNRKCLSISLCSFIEIPKTALFGLYEYWSPSR